MIAAHDAKITDARKPARYSDAVAERSGSKFVLALLAASMFLMALDASVMNVSIANVARDVNSNIHGIQIAMSLYTLVMASLMIAGGKLGSQIGRRRTMSLGLVIYASGSGLTALAHSLPVLIFGWSLLEGIGAALIMPSIVALIADNFPPDVRSRAYGIVTSASAVAITVGPVVGGLVTSLASWRYVFTSEVVIAVFILINMRRMAEGGVAARERFDVPGFLVSALGMVTLVFAAIQAGEWGWWHAKSHAPSIGRLSLVPFLFVGGILVWIGFVLLERSRQGRGKSVLLDPRLLAQGRIQRGLASFFVMNGAMSGIFFVMPLFLVVASGLTPLGCGLRMIPLSIALLFFAGVGPRFLAGASVQKMAMAGMTSLLVGTLLFALWISPDASPIIVALPMLFVGSGLGLLSTQLGATTVSGAPLQLASQVGGLQNTFTNLGLSLGTAVAGSIMIASLGAHVLAGLSDIHGLNEAQLASVTVAVTDNLAIVSNAQLSEAIDKTGATEAQKQEAIAVNENARAKALEASLWGVSCIEAVGLLVAWRLPRQRVGSLEPPETISS